jgi:hypothetical protein
MRARLQKVEPDESREQQEAPVHVQGAGFGAERE